MDLRKLNDKIISNLSKLLTIHDISINEFNIVLKDSESVIAGGSLLTLYHDDDFMSNVKDIDIYVNSRNFEKLIGFFIKKNLYCRVDGTYVLPPYDDSFFYENGIIVRFPFNNNKSYYFDIIVIVDEKNVLDVVNNFDLTFCEINYNGESVNTNFPTEIVNKEGYIRSSYLKKIDFDSYFDMNKFILVRIKKYNNKSYKIANIPQLVNKIITEEKDEDNDEIGDGAINYNYESVSYDTYSNKLDDSIRVGLKLLNAFLRMDIKNSILNIIYTDKLLNIIETFYKKHNEKYFHNTFLDFFSNKHQINYVGVAIFNHYKDIITNKFTFDDMEYIMNDLGFKNKKMIYMGLFNKLQLDNDFHYADNLYDFSENHILIPIMRIMKKYFKNTKKVINEYDKYETIIDNTILYKKYYYNRYYYINNIQCIEEIKHILENYYKIDKKMTNHIYNFIKKEKLEYVTSETDTYKQGYVEYYTRWFKYKGEFVNNVIHGKGKIWFINDSIFEGTFKNGMFLRGKMTISIRGNIIRGIYENDVFSINNDDKMSKYDIGDIYKYDKIIYENGDIYIGEIMNNEKNGYGILTYANGDVYEGEFINNERNGHGKHTLSGNIYIGEYRNDKRNGYFKSIFDGDIYEGEYIDNVRNEFGKYTFDNGDIYEGKIVDNKFKYGKYTYVNGDIYEGEYIDNVRNGYGKFTFVNGDIYIGEYRDDKKNGYGKYTFANGDIYEGEYREDEQNGYGKFTYANGNFYLGKFKNGNYEYGKFRNGNGKYTNNGNIYEGDKIKYGILTYANGDIYIGQFINNEKNGQGTFTYVNGDIYIGEFVDDIRNGYGKYTFANGVYIGEWKDNKMNGNGTFTYVNGDIYKGEFVDDERNGYGKYTYVNGDIYKGQYKDNRMNGYGTFTYVNGDIYIGEYRDDKRNGYGKYTFANGVYIGEWKDNKMNGNGTFTYVNGDIYKGEFVDDEINGYGKYTNANGDIYKGEWKDGKM
jgi:hypothetical protein